MAVRSTAMPPTRATCETTPTRPFTVSDELRPAYVQRLVEREQVGELALRRVVIQDPGRRGQRSLAHARRVLLQIAQGTLRGPGECEDIALLNRRRRGRIEVLAARQSSESHHVAAARHGLGRGHAETFLLAEAQEYRAGPEQLSGLPLPLAVDAHDLPALEAAAEG